jgi:hypothetical protein
MRLATALILLMLAPAPGVAQTYFPQGVLGSTPQASDAAAGLYSEFLQAAHETSLWDLSRQDSTAESYRLLLLRTFDRPASVRLLVKPGGTGWFYRRMTRGTGATQPGGIGEWGMSWSWKSRTASFRVTIEDAGFWNLPTMDANAKTAVHCRSHWILEGVKNGKYHIVDRCSPVPADPVRVIGTRLMKLRNLRLRASQVY